MKLSVPGNLIAGAIARTSVGFVLNPITVLKARYEVCFSLTFSMVIKSWRLIVRVIDIRNTDRFLPHSKTLCGLLESEVCSRE